MSDENMDLVEAFLSETEGPTSASAEGEELVDVELSESEETLPEGHRSGFVALIGRPNVGKSTLVNSLVGQKVSIVSHKSQTTRTRVSGILTDPAYQLIFIDTPGIHKKLPYKLNRLMVDQALAAIPDADVILFVVDVSVPPTEEDEAIAQILKERASKHPVFFVMNKMDRLSMERAEQRIESYWALFPDYADSIPTSALQDTNIALLRDHVLERIPEGPRYYPGGQVSDQTDHQIASELVREAVLRYTRQEIPHAVAVIIESYQERENGDFYISATIWVERDSQKPILIGKGGQKLKQIGTAARAELERFVAGNVYVDLWVKVKPKWRNHEGRLRELGL